MLSPSLVTPTKGEKDSQSLALPSSKGNVRTAVSRRVPIAKHSTRALRPAASIAGPHPISIECESHNCTEGVRTLCKLSAVAGMRQASPQGPTYIRGVMLRRRCP